MPSVFAAVKTQLHYEGETINLILPDKGDIMVEIPVRASAPAWPRWVGAFGLIWNLYGVYQYLGTVGALGAAASQSQMASAMPGWVSAAFGISVVAGALGGLCLVLLNRWATWLLLLSLLTDLLWGARILSGNDANSAMGLVVAATLIDVLLAWAAYAAGKKGWLR
jgi:hypothetical protein